MPDRLTPLAFDMLDPTSYQRFDTVYQALCYMSHQRPSQSRAVLLRELDILRKLEAVSREIHGEYVPGTREPMRQLNLSGDFPLTGPEEDLVVDYIQGVAWRTGHRTRRALATLRWLREIPPRRSVRKRLFADLVASNAKDAARLKVCHMGLILSTVKFERKAINVLLLEESLLDEFSALMAPCPAGAMLGPDEPCMVLSKDGRLSLDFEQYDFLYAAIESTPWTPRLLADYAETMAWLDTPRPALRPAEERASA